MKISSQEDPVPSEQGPLSFLTVKEIAVSGLAFLLAGLAYFAEMVTADLVFGGADLVSFFIPFRQLWLREIADFTLPLWNPYILSGNPLFATLQPAILYPPSILFILFPFYFAMNMTIILHFVMAGWFMYLFMRAQSCSRQAAVVSAFIFMFGGYLVAVRVYLSTFLPVVWVPLLLLCFFAGLRKQDMRWSLAASAVGACMFLSGGVETCYQVFAWISLFALFLHWVFPNETLPNWKWRTGYLALFITVFFGLVAIQFLPTYELSQLTERVGGVRYKEAVHWSMLPRDILQFLLLDPYGYLSNPGKAHTNQVWMRSIYIGGIPFLLSWFYIRQGGARAWSCTGIVLVSILVAMGPNAVLFDVFYKYLPGFSTFRYPVKFIFPAVLILAVMAGWGWDVLVRDSREDPDRTRSLARNFIYLAAGLMMVFGFLNLWDKPIQFWMVDMGWVPPDFTEPRINLGNVKRLLVFTALFAFFLFLFWNSAQRKTRWIFAALFIFSLDIVFSGMGSYPKIPIKEVTQDTALIRFVQSDPSWFRIYIADHVERGKDNKVHDRMVRGNTIRGPKTPLTIRTELGVYQAGGWAVMRQFRYLKYKKIMRVPKLEERLNLISMASVKYVISRDPLHSDQLKQVEFHDPTYPELKVYENLGRVPRAYLVRSCRIFTDEDMLIAKILNSDFDPTRLVMLEEPPPSFACEESPQEKVLPGRVQVTGHGYDTVDLEAETDQPAFLILGDSWYPGWEATVNGEPVPIIRAQYVFRAIELPAGKHQIRFEYKPASFRWGMAISLLTIVLGAGFLLKPKRRYEATPN